MIEITLLGSAAAMPTPQRGMTAAALRCGGRCILFDCGEGTQVALRREKISPLKIDLIALSHFHGDHIFGLPGLLQTMSCLRRTEPLIITGPEGLEDAMEPILRLAGVTDFPVRLLPCPENSGLRMRQLHPAWPDGACCVAVPTAHRAPSQGYVFTLSRPPRFSPEKARELDIPVSQWREIIARPEEPVLLEGVPLLRQGLPVYGHMLMGKPRRGLRFVFSGDTLPCQAMVTAAAGADLLIHDATYGEDSFAEQARLYGHSTFRQAAELAAQAQVRELWLCHFSQTMERPEDCLPLAQSIFPASRCGYDGLRATLRFDESE
ncbi:MAG: ribonuclease Z [Candidatus Limivicinus sp.]